MENCTIYSHHVAFEKVHEIVASHLQKAKIDIKDQGIQKSLVATSKGGLFSKSKTLTINYRQRLNPSYKIDKIECGLTQNLSGMANFVQSLPAKNEVIRNKFMIKLMSVNIEMAFLAEPAINDDFTKILKEIVLQLDGFIFTPPSPLFNSSSAQHFLDKHLNLILDTQGNCNVQDLDVTVDAKYHDQAKEEYTENQMQRKQRSERFLESKQIKINTNLPCQADEANINLRSKHEVIDRAYALMIIAAKGEGVPTDNLQKPIEEKRINRFSAKEESILSTTELDDNQKAYATWRYESLYTLLWAMNFMPDLKFPDEICDVKTIVGSMLKPSREEFEDAISLRDKKEILDELDKTYRMSWASVDARIKGIQLGGNINPSIIYERHYALNWLIQYQNQAWDDVQTNT